MTFFAIWPGHPFFALRPKTDSYLVFCDLGLPVLADTLTSSVAEMDIVVTLQNLVKRVTGPVCL